MGDKLERMDEVCLRFRTRTEDDVTWVIAGVVFDDGVMTALARLRVSVIDGAGDPLYQDWVSLISKLYAASIERATGATVAQMKRAKPNREGEVDG